ncbi:MAG: alpha/beta fold hydrolase [Steroidobacteraceae bacterium]|jgi:haloacetate dehalogenase
MNFPGFKPIRIETSEATINGVIGGSGPPLLLLHGWPQSHIEWRKVTPTLARHFTVVATDLRGYGESSKPADLANHQSYSKRSMAKDQVEVMRRLGYERFPVVGHDRGGRTAHRMALDYPSAVSKVAVIDIVPTLKIFTPITKEFAAVYSHWFLMLEPAPIPETLLMNSADFYLRTKWFRGLIPDVISEDVYAQYLRHFKDPATMHSMCEDYRAAATMDLEHDRADLDAKIQCPLLALWGREGAMERCFDVLAAWRERAVDVQGEALPGGHWLPEQLPDEVAGELLAFLLQQQPISRP